MVECYSPFNKTMAYYGNKTSPGAHFPFNFMFIVDFDQQSDASKVYNIIKAWMTSMPENEWANWVVIRFLLLLGHNFMHLHIFPITL